MANSSITYVPPMKTVDRISIDGEAETTLLVHYFAPDDSDCMLRVPFSTYLQLLVEIERRLCVQALDSQELNTPHVDLLKKLEDTDTLHALLAKLSR